MVINRFFTDHPIGERVILEDDEHHHLTKVVRGRVGEKVEVVDGKGALAQAEIAAIDRRKAELKILSITRTIPAPPKLILIQGICRQNRLDTILEKGTELGVDEFLFVSMDRSEKRPLNHERMRRLTISALKQCGRLILPSISQVPHLSNYKGSQPLLFGDLSPGSKSIFEQGPFTSAAIAIGPESGFSEEELTYLREKGAGVSLHTNILRCDTAAILAVGLFSQKL